MFARVVAVLFVVVGAANAFSWAPTWSARSVRSALSMVGGGRLPFIAGNWKMNTELQSAVALASELADLTKDIDPKKVEMLVCPPYPFIRDVKMATEKSNIKVGAQNCFYELKGAFTGAVSAPMLKSVGCDYALVGHSERRKIFRETDVDINHALAFVQQHAITPILCIGETKEEYELGLNEEICVLQLRKDLKELTPEQVGNIVIAYEPVWAIGTGLSATPKIAQDVHAAIRKWIAKQYGTDVANKIRILYGGSVTPETVDELMRCPDIDGCLVGGASLTSKSFARICAFQP